MNENSLEPVRILGVCSSPRRASTLYCLQQALEEAEKVSGVQTSLLHLRGKDQVKPCLHCDYCLRHPLRCSQKDLMNEVYDSLLDYDGFLIATPVYIGTVSGQLKAFLDRLRAVWVRASALTGKAGGAIAVGGDRAGGHEPALMTIVSFYLTFGVLPVAGVPGGNLGACVWAPDPTAPFSEPCDPEGLRVVRALGLRLAHHAAWLKRARQTQGPILPNVDPMALNATMAAEH